MSWIVRMPTSSRVAEVKAVTATGTSCNASSRRSAVTTTSSSTGPVGAASWAKARSSNAKNANAAQPIRSVDLLAMSIPPHFRALPAQFATFGSMATTPIASHRTLLNVRYVLSDVNESVFPGERASVDGRVGALAGARAFGPAQRFRGDLSGEVFH